MATEKRLIDANALSEKIGNMKFEITHNRGGYRYCNEEEKNEWDKLDGFDSLVCDAPTVDAVSRGVHDQVRWERDVAIHQLEEHGISFGCIAPDVVKVVRCKDCKHYMLWEDSDDEKTCAKSIGLMVSAPDDFCSYGERRAAE